MIHESNDHDPQLLFHDIVHHVIVTMQTDM